MSTTLFANPYPGTPLGFKLDEFADSVVDALKPYDSISPRRVSNIQAVLAEADVPMPANNLAGLERDLRQGFARGEGGFKPQRLTLRQERSSDGEWLLIAIITAGR